MKKIIVVLAIGCLLFSSCGDSPKPKETEFKDSIEQIKMIYDVPTLLNKNVDEIVKILGKPKNWTDPTKLQMKNGFDTWDNTFIISNLELMVTYNPQNKKVQDFFVPTSDPSGATSDYSNLLKMCNLTESNSNYTIKPVAAMKDKSKYTGIIISPNN
jgi:hypothetical protein